MRSVPAGNAFKQQYDFFNSTGSEAKSTAPECPSIECRGTVSTVSSSL
jgi:hypothetical protein